MAGSFKGSFTGFASLSAKRMDSMGKTIPFQFFFALIYLNIKLS